MSAIYDFTAKTLAGKDVSLADYKGQALLIVNTASKWGFTPQYERLETLTRRCIRRASACSAFPVTSLAARSRAAKMRSASSARGITA